VRFIITMQFYKINIIKLIADQKNICSLCLVTLRYKNDFFIFYYFIDACNLY